jgi:hypothetical protein
MLTREQLLHWLHADAYRGEEASEEDANGFRPEADKG